MKHLLLILALMSLTLRPFAQAPPLERIGIAQGLSQGFVTCLLQDREGFLWAGTMNGLNRYDGHRFKIFRNDPFDSLSLSANFIFSLCEAGDFLLVGTLGTGLNIFDKKTQRFYRLPASGYPDETSAANALRLASARVHAILLDAGGNLWVHASWGGGEAWLTQIMLPEGFWKDLAKEGSALGRMSGKLKLRELALKNEEFIWKFFLAKRDKIAVAFSHSEGLFWDENSSKWQSLTPAFPHPDSALQCKTSFGNFWLDKAGRFWDFNKSLFPLADWSAALPEGSLVWTQQGNSAKAHQINGAAGLSDFDAPHWVVENADERGILYFDRSGNTWLTANANGLLKISFQANRFRTVFLGESLSSPPVATPGGNIVWNRAGYDLHFLNGKDSLLKEGLLRIYAKNQLAICRLAFDKTGNCWMFGMPYFGQVFLSKTNRQTGESQSWKLPFSMYNLSNFAFDDQGKVWMSPDRQLVCFDPRDFGAGSATEKWTVFDYRHLLPKGSSVLSLAKTADGSWWLATENGLVRAKPVGSRQPAVNSGQSAIQPFNHSAIQQFDFQLLLPNPADRNGLNCSNIASLLTDPADPNLLWIGTKGGGLNRLDLHTGRFSHFTTKNGLPDDVVYGILPDYPPSGGAGGVGRLWLSTNRGLACFFPATGAVKNYRQADGLQDDEFNTWAYGNSDSYRKNGELMFGGVKGLNVFNPKDIEDNPNKPNVFITGLKINNLPVETGDSSGILSEAIEFCQKIKLPYSKNNVTLEFAALEFTAPSKNRFRYYLEGAEKEWEHESSEPSASYLNLQPGTYTFKVLGSNNDGVWSEQPAKLQIRVLPPWYRSKLAYLTYTLLLGGLVFWIRSQELGQKTARHELEINRLKLEEFTQRLLEKTQIIAELQRQPKPETTGDHPADPEDVDRLYKSHILTNDDWENFRNLFARVYPGFLQQIAYRLPQLTSGELRLVLLTKMGLKTAEAAAMLGVSPESVKKGRHRLRKKLYLEEQPLEDLLASF